MIAIVAVHGWNPGWRREGGMFVNGRTKFLCELPLSLGVWST